MTVAETSPSTAVNGRADDVKQSLSSLVDDSVDIVRARAQGLEELFKPVADWLRDAAHERPVIFTFLAVFATLSILPMLTYLGILIFATTCLISFAVIAFLAAVSTMLFIGFLIMTPILTFTAFISFIATVSLLGLFLVSRLYMITRDNNFSVSTGLSEWYAETRDRAGFPIPSSKATATDMVEAPSPPQPVVTLDIPALTHGSPGLLIVATKDGKGYEIQPVDTKAPPVAALSDTMADDGEEEVTEVESNLTEKCGEEKAQKVDGLKQGAPALSEKATAHAL